jgi:hypothetical protein
LGVVAERADAESPSKLRNDNAPNCDVSASLWHARKIHPKIEQTSARAL